MYLLWAVTKICSIQRKRKTSSSNFTLQRMGNNVQEWLLYFLQLNEKKMADIQGVFFSHIPPNYGGNKNLSFWGKMEEWVFPSNHSILSHLNSKIWE